MGNNIKSIGSEDSAPAYVEQSPTKKQIDNPLILLIGLPDAGKGTFFKQFVASNGLRTEDYYKEDVHAALIKTTKTTNRELFKNRLSFETTKIIKLMEIEDDKYLDEIPGFIEILAMKPLFRSTLRNFYFEERYQIPSGMVHLILKNDLKRFRPPGYKATFMDMLCVKELKLVEIPFRIGNQVYLLNCPKDSFIYVSSLMNYFTGHLARDLEMYRQMVKDPENEDKNVILIFNKIDELNYFHGLYPLSKFCPDFKGPETLQDICLYIQDEFFKIRRFGVFVHFLTAFESTQMKSLTRCFGSIISIHQCNCEYASPKIRHLPYNFKVIKDLDDMSFKFDSAMNIARKFTMLQTTTTGRNIMAGLGEQLNIEAVKSQSNVVDSLKAEDLKEKETSPRNPQRKQSFGGLFSPRKNSSPPAPVPTTSQGGSPRKAPERPPRMDK